MRPARVIGAGLSGLAAAWHLADRGFEVSVCDEADGPGGLIQTRRSHYGLVETAANAFVWTETVAQWFNRLQLTPVFGREESKRRYIFRDGRPRRWPLSLTQSAGMAGRLALTAATRGFSARPGETIQAWGDRVIGANARAWLLEPAMQGIYAAPSSMLSAEAIFAGRRRGPRRMAAPSDGMGEFTTALHRVLAVRGVRFEFNQRVDAVDPAVPTAICTGAVAAARLLAPHAPETARRVAAVRVSPLLTVTMFFAPSPDDLRGFGVLFPATAGVQALGVLFNADIFAGRSDFRSETWIVGDRDSKMTAWSDAALLAALADDRQHLTGRREDPLETPITRWPSAVPVYDFAILAVQRAVADLPPGIALAGNYLGQIGVAALLDLGEAAAARLASK